MKSDYNNIKLVNSKFTKNWLSATTKPLIIFSLLCLFFIQYSTALLASGQTAKIKVAQYDKVIEFTCKADTAWKLGNNQGTISSKDICKITGKLGSKAIQKFHVLAKSVPIEDKSELNVEILKWKKQGWDIKIIEIGSPLRNAKGQITNDPRLAAGEIAVFSSEYEAQQLTDKLAELGQDTQIYTETIKLPIGEISLIVNGETKATGDDLVLKPTETILLKQVEFAAGYPWHGFENRTFRGQLSFHWGAKNAIDCILFTDLEEILAGVVPSEISANAAIGALQAQAVAARGDIMAKMGVRHIGEGFDICAEQHCQVFKGESKYSIAVGKKIAPTAGYLLTDAKGKILDAVYSSNCGGHSEANHLVWSTKPNPILCGVWDHPNPPAMDLSEEKQVKDFILNPPKCFCNNPNVEGGNRFRWTKSITGSSWKTVSDQLNIGRITEVTDIARGFSGRIYQMTFKGTSGEKTVFKELTIRRLFNSLRSSCFTADWKKDASGYIIGANFTGAGFGHGVGMCQTGAQSQAKLGWNFKKILTHYYPGSILKKWY